MFNLRQAEIYDAIKAEKNFKTLAVLKNILLLLFLLAIAYLGYEIFIKSAALTTLVWLEGLTLIIFTQSFGKM
jgi:TRAP-type C4-dicarboxylate transport system permease small subunit